MFHAVSASAWTPPPEELDLPGMDPVFIAGEGHELRLPSWYPAQAMEAHLAHCLLRAPKDLTSHTRRILFWQEQPGHAGLPDALADLAQVLEDKGDALLRRLSQRSGHLLNDSGNHSAPTDRGESPYALFTGAAPFPDLPEA